MSSAGARGGAQAGNPVARTGAAPFLQYLCRVCGLIYDEAEGDPDSGLAPGTRFADIPDDWGCPICGVGKADFELIAAASADDDRPAKGGATRALRAASRPVAGSTRPARRGNAGVVIVGAGRAGWEIAAALRAVDAALPITMVAACSADVYDKPQLSVAVARGLDPASLVRETAASAAARLGVRLVPNTHAVDLCTRSRRLRTTRGSLHWQHLVLAHGATPTLPAVLPASRVWRCNDLPAYQRLRAQLAGRPQRVLIVGAGLVGCELANDLALAGHRITVLDVQDRPLAAALPAQASAALLSAWQSLPIQFVGAVHVCGVDAAPVGESGLRVRTVEGQVFDVDQVIAATGLRAPSRLAQRARLAYDAKAGGLVVDPDSLQTSAPGVFALGDCVVVNGTASRYIAPIAAQARAIAAAIRCGIKDRGMAQRGRAATTAGAHATVADPAAVQRLSPEGAVPDACVLRVKTSSWPITLEGQVPAGGRWLASAARPSDAPDVLRLVCHDTQGRIAARLVGGPARPGAARAHLHTPSAPNT